jgi:hypothetical protein
LSPVFANAIALPVDLVVIPGFIVNRPKQLNNLGLLAASYVFIEGRVHGIFFVP